MGVNSLYTNIDHEEGTYAYYKKLETRKNKTVPSNTSKNCILLILKSNIFRFCNTFHIQKKGQQWVRQWLLIMQTYFQLTSATPVVSKVEKLGTSNLTKLLDITAYRVDNFNVGKNLFIIYILPVTVEAVP